MWAYVIEGYFVIGVSCIIVYGSIYINSLKDDVCKLVILVLMVGGLLCVNMESYDSNVLVDNKLSVSITGKVLTCGFGGLCLWVKSKYESKFEYSVLVLLICLGLVLVMNSNDLLSMYLGIELQSLGLYVLAAYRKGSSYATESGLKYYIIGGFGSGLLLFGSSLVYGGSGTLEVTNIGRLLLIGNNEIVNSGILLIIVGLLFKLGAAPFHMWIIDVIEGASMRTSKIFSVVPKVGVLVMLIRLLIEVPISIWQDWIIMVSMVSMIVSVVGAVYQRKIKRFMGYSGIGHIGYMLVGVSVGIDGIESVLMYMGIYMVTSYIVWGIIEEYSIVYIEELGKICVSNKYLGMTVCLLLFSMAGIPPLGGFFVKLNLLVCAIEHELYLLSVVAVLCTVIGGFNYLRWVKVIYYEKVSKRVVMYSEVNEKEGIVKGLGVMVLSVIWLL